MAFTTEVSGTNSDGRCLTSARMSLVCVYTSPNLSQRLMLKSSHEAQPRAVTVLCLTDVQSSKYGSLWYVHKNVLVSGITALLGNKQIPVLNPQ
jgi:hypothetical protein